MCELMYPSVSVQYNFSINERGRERGRGREGGREEGRVREREG